jgi:hypothetical protein
MIGTGERAFAPGYRRYRVHQGGVPSYLVVGPDGRVSASDREAWLRSNWKVLRRRIETREGVVIEELDADEGAGPPDAAEEVAG